MEFNVYRSMFTILKSIPVSTNLLPVGPDQESLGDPTPMGQMGVPQAQAVDWKTLAKISPQSLGNGISESLDLKIFPVSPGLLDSCISHFY